MCEAEPANGAIYDLRGARVVAAREITETVGPQIAQIAADLFNLRKTASSADKFRHIFSRFRRPTRCILTILSDTVTFALLPPGDSATQLEMTLLREPTTERLRRAIRWSLLTAVLLALVPTRASTQQFPADLPRRVPYVAAEHVRSGDLRRLPLVAHRNDTRQPFNSELVDLTFDTEYEILDDRADILESWTTEAFEPLGSSAPQALNLAGRQVDFGFDAAVQLDLLHDFNALGLSPNGGVEREFITADIPVGGPAARRDNRTALSPNQTYFDVWAQTPTDYGNLRAFARGNLARPVTSAEFQIYLAYATWGWLKAGFDYTLWLNQDATPNTLDFEAGNSIPWVRYGQVALEIPLDDCADCASRFFVIGIEDAPADVTLPTGIVAVNTVDRLPSVVGKFVFEPDWAHMELASLYRRLYAQGVGYDSTVNGWGVSLSGRFDTWGNDSFILGGFFGEALGAYIEDAQGFGKDAAPTSASDPNLKAIPAVGTWAGYEHWWNVALRSVGSYGFVGLNNNFDPVPNPVGIYHQTHYASINLVWSPIPSVDVGVEYLYGHRLVTRSTPVDGSRTGDDHRLHATVRWNFGYQRSGSGP